MENDKLVELALFAGEEPTLDKIDDMLRELALKDRCLNVSEIEDMLLDIRDQIAS